MEAAILDIETQQSLPAGWQWKRLGDIGKISSGTTPSRAKQTDYFMDGTMHWVKTADLNNSLIKATQEKVTDLALSETSLKVYPPRTLLVAMYGGYNQIGRTGLLTISATVNQALSALQCKLELAYPEYVLIWLNGNIERWKGFAGSSRKDPNITGKDVNDFPILLPPLAEQQRIATILIKWDEAIKKLQMLIDKKNHYKQGLMQHLLTGNRRFSEFAGQAWETVRFGEVFTFLRNESHSRECLTYENTENQVYYVHYGDIHATFETSILDFSKETRIPRLKDEVNLLGKSALLHDGDLLIADASEDYAGVGECMEVKNIDNKLAVGGLHTMVARDQHNRTAPGFRSYLLLHPEVAIAIRKAANGISVYGLSKTALSNVLIHLPPLAEQRRIAAVISAADLEIEGLNKELTLLKSQQSGLMQGLLTGNMSVKHLI